MIRLFFRLQDDFNLDLKVEDKQLDSNFNDSDSRHDSDVKACKLQHDADSSVRLTALIRSLLVTQLDSDYKAYDLQVDSNFRTQASVYLPVQGFLVQLKFKAYNSQFDSYPKASDWTQNDSELNVYDFRTYDSI